MAKRKKGSKKSSKKARKKACPTDHWFGSRCIKSAKLRKWLMFVKSHGGVKKAVAAKRRGEY